MIRLWVALLLLPGFASAQTLRFATWNIENFWHIENESLRGPYKGRDTIRDEEDYAALRATIASLDADIWALQEIGSPDALAALFPAPAWTIVFSPRHASDTRINPRQDFDPQTRDIYTALAIRADSVAILETSFIALNVEGTDRMGTAAKVQLADQIFWIASVHLKAGCQSDNPGQSSRAACGIMDAQIPVLETWIDERLENGLLMGGDFNRTLVGYNSRQPGEDPVWEDLSDGAPATLLSFPFAPSVNCPEGRYGESTWPVDFILASADWALRASPGPYMRGQGGRVLSDHCPVLVEFAQF